jgi:hypothetical protein
MPLGVVITPGVTETRDGFVCSVPKLTLVSRLQALLHQARLKPNFAHFWTYIAEKA